MNPKAYISAEFHGNRSKTEEVVCNTSFSILSAHIMLAVIMATLFITVEKCVLQTLHPKMNIYYEFCENWPNIQEVVSRTNDFPLYFAQNMHNCHVITELLTF